MGWLRQQVRRIAWPRLAVGAIGLLLIAVGVRAAWRSDSGTAPLIIGAALLVVALVFSRYLEELTLHGREGWSLTVKQYPPPGAVALGEIADEVGEIARDEAATPVRERLAEVAERARAAEAEAYAAARQPDPRFVAWAADLAHATQRGDRVQADIEPSYAFSRSSASDDIPTRLETGEVSIAFSFRWWGDWGVVLRVTDPNGIQSTSLVVGSRYMMGNNFVGNYPTNFDDAPAVVPGDYMFEWCRAVDYYTNDVGGVLRRDRVTVSTEIFEKAPYAAGLDPAREHVPSEHEQRVAVSTRLR